MLYSEFVSAQRESALPENCENLAAYVADYNAIVAAIAENNMSELRLLCPDLQDLRPVYSFQIEKTFRKKSSTWGEYSPKYELVVYKTYTTTNGARYITVDHREFIGFHKREANWQRTLADWQRRCLSEDELHQRALQTKCEERTYKDAVLVTKRLVYRGKLLDQAREISLGKEHYTLKLDESLSAGYKALQNEISRRKEAAKRKKAARAAA